MIIKNKNIEWITIIEPKNGKFNINFNELFKYRDLVTLFVYRTFISQYKQTILGPAWAIIQPLLTTVVFTIIFGNIAKLPTDGIPPFLFYMCGNIAWGYFAGSLSTTSTTFVTNSGIFGKVYFPRLVMPVAVVFNHLISFTIQGLFFLGFWTFYFINPLYKITPNFCLVLIPFLILEMAMLSLGIGIIVSALTTKYRDLAMLVSFVVQLWMYATPIAYASSLIPEKLMPYYMLNPMTPIIETFRYAFFGSGKVSIYYLLISAGVTLFVLFIGIVLFNRVEKTFMDTV